MPLINTRSDLDAIAGTPEHTEFLNMLKGSVYRLEKDDMAKQWTLHVDTSTIAKYGFTISDFPDLAKPDIPDYVHDPIVTPKSVPMRSVRLALLQTGKLSIVNTIIANMQGTEGDAARIEWEYAQEVRRNSALVISLISLLGMTEAEIDSMFILAATL